MPHTTKLRLTVLVVALASRGEFAQAQKLYWSNHTGIHRSNTDGTFIEPLEQQGLEFVLDLVLDHKLGKLFFTSGPTANRAICQADLDGRSPETIIEPTAGDRYALDVDSENRMLYWFDVPTQTIQRISLDGGLSEMVYALFPACIRSTYYSQRPPVAIDLENHTVYWVCARVQPDDGYYDLYSTIWTGSENQHWNIYTRLLKLNVTQVNALKIGPQPSMLFWHQSAWWNFSYKHWGIPQSYVGLVDTRGTDDPGYEGYDLEPQPVHALSYRSVWAFAFDHYRSDVFYVYTRHSPSCDPKGPCDEGISGPYAVRSHLNAQGNPTTELTIFSDMGAYDMAIDSRGPGDYNLDRKVDLLDFSHFQNCVTAPVESSFLPGCAFFDADPADQDIDLMDFASFTTSMSIADP